MEKKRKMAGILAPLFALRGSHDLGIGDTHALMELLEWSSEHGFGAIQLLPVNETGKSNSPYNTLSVIALEPSTITTHPSWISDLTPRHYESIISSYDLVSLRGRKVSYPLIKALKQNLLFRAWKNFQKDPSSPRWKEFFSFQKAQAYWLPDYTLYRALLERHHHQETFSKWEPLTRQAATAYPWLETLPNKERLSLEKKRQFFAYVQWIAWSQWEKVSQKATTLGIVLIGDVPIGVHIAGADLFSKPELFNTHSFGGCPPEKVFLTDPFTEKWGQNWGIPLYKWKDMAKDNFQWWRHRLRTARSLFHYLRIDHTLGLFRMYTFPWPPEQNTQFKTLSPQQTKKLTGGILPHFEEHADDTPAHRKYNKARGRKLLEIFREEVGPDRLIAEDLGTTTSYVPKVLSQLHIPGFKLPHWLKDPHHGLLPPHKYPFCAIATYANHDHEPFRKQWEEWQLLSQTKGKAARAAKKRLRNLLLFAGGREIDILTPYPGKVHQTLLEGLYSTRAWLAVVMINDLFGTTEQFNIPGRLSQKNWRERLNFPISSWNKKYHSILVASDRALKKWDRFHS